jgi:hypothetical protein
MPDAQVGDTVNGHMLTNDGRVGVIVRNVSTDTAYNLTIRLTRTVDGQPVTPRVIALPANTAKAFGPFNPGDYGSSVALDVDNASLTLLAVRVA